MGTMWIGNVRSMESPESKEEAIFVENGYIVSVGTEKVLREKYKDKIDQVMDVRPYTIYPGFVDSHMHLLATGLKLSRLDFTAVQSPAEMKEMIVRQVSETPPGEWIIGEGWNENEFIDRKIFHRRELDVIASYHPVALTRVCRHAILANSMALAQAGITADTPDPDGGLIVRDEQGSPTGLLHDQARFLLTDTMPLTTDAELERACRKAIKHCLSLGLTGSHSEDLNDHGGYKPAMNVYRKVLDQTDMRYRIHLLVHNEAVDDMQAEGIQTGDKIGDLTIGAMKIFADGVLGSRTAWLRRPYNDAPDTVGIGIHTQEELNERVKKGRDNSMPVAIHTIGDAALEAAITAIEKYPNPSYLPDRIIHGQIAPRDLRHRLLQLPVIIDIQPSFVPSDFPWVIERLGEERMSDSYAWKTLIDEGLVCAGGSDAPIEYANPIFGIYAAVARKKVQDDHDGFYPRQKLSVFEAIQLYTLGSAQAVSEESESGFIKSGFRADFTILEKDLLNMEEEDIPYTRVKMTVVDNKVMYQSDKE